MKKLAKLTDSEEGGRQDGTASVNARLWLFCYIHPAPKLPSKPEVATWEPGAEGPQEATSKS